MAVGEVRWWSAQCTRKSFYFSSLYLTFPFSPLPLPPSHILRKEKKCFSSFCSHKRERERDKRPFFLLCFLSSSPSSPHGNQGQNASRFGQEMGHIFWRNSPPPLPPFPFLPLGFSYRLLAKSPTACHAASTIVCQTRLFLFLFLFLLLLLLLLSFSVSGASCVGPQFGGHHFCISVASSSTRWGERKECALIRYSIYKYTMTS